MITLERLFATSHDGVIKTATVLISLLNFRPASWHERKWKETTSSNSIINDKEEDEH